MKRIIRQLTVLSLLGLLIASVGCAPAPKASKISPARFQEKVRVYEADMRARLQDMDTRLEMLQGGGLQLSDQAKDKWLESSEWFENTKDAFRIKLEAVTSQSPESWNMYRDSMNQQWEVLEGAFQELKRSVGK